MASLKRKAEGKTTMPNAKKAKVAESTTEPSVPLFDQFLIETVIFIFPAGIQKARLQLFRSQIEKFGGLIRDSCTNDVTHIVVDDAMTSDRMCKIMKTDTPPSNKTIVKSAWLSACLREKQVVDHSSFLLSVISASKSVKPPDCETKTVPKSSTILENAYAVEQKQMLPKVGVMWNAFTKGKGSGSESDYVLSDDDTLATSNKTHSEGPSTSSAGTTPDTSPVKKLPVGKWICAQSSKAPKMNLNEHITAKLEEMAKNYESTNDKWRVFGYQKAVAALRRHPKEITSWEEARSLQGVGSKLADKIWEIVQSGELRKLNEFQSSEQVKVLKLFTNVWGAGPTTANSWYQQGFRTLDDLKTKANLTHQQKVGVRLYDDILDRMPREEAAEIEQVVKKAAESIQPGIIAHACGSYRRGKKDCGDVDILLTHPDGHSEKGLFTQLIKHLKETGFLTDDLVSVEDNGKQKKYLGVCKLPGPNRRHRRLDIIVVPYEEYACALIYFTGSAHFNRSLRHLCKKMNMSLNEHALRTGVVRKGQEKIYEGVIVPTPTEESVLTALGVPYRPPEERDH